MATVSRRLIRTDRTIDSLERRYALVSRHYGSEAAAPIGRELDALYLSRARMLVPDNAPHRALVHHVSDAVLSGDAGAIVEVS